jgi:hypothetical protein
MKEPFTSNSGPMNIESKTINNEYDAFRLFFDEEIYGMIIKHSLDKNSNN